MSLGSNADRTAMSANDLDLVLERWETERRERTEVVVWTNLLELELGCKRSSDRIKWGTRRRGGR